MCRKIWTAAAAAVIALGAAGCGAGAGGAGEAAAPASPRPEGTGPLTKEVVRADIGDSAAAAGVPASALEYAPNRADGQPSCAVSAKGFGSKSASLDATSLDVAVRALGAREWRQSQGRTERKGKDGSIGEARVLLTQRGWSMVAEYRYFGEGGVITFTAFDDACMKQNGSGAGPAG
ncbi:hypothetical protein OV450_2537 [Actinobacteria bacterium OV450]|nr:hypothetical protein OV450_2537 [Actinobacteria bacterium OV450]